MRSPTSGFGAALLLASLAGCGGDLIPAAAALSDAPIERAFAGAPRDEVARFYRARGFRPLWLKGGRPTPAAAALLAELRRPDLNALVADAGRGPDAAARAEIALSRAFADHALALRRTSGRVKLAFVDAALSPRLTTRALLEEAAAAPSLEAHLSAIRNPIVDQLRAALAAYEARHGADDPQVAVIRANIERARALPAAGIRRFVLVDTAGQQLWMFEGGRIADSMRVIVGKQAHATPAMAGVIRYAVLNPYWNLPPDLVRERALQVLDGGELVIRQQRLELLADWSGGAQLLDPDEVDWRAVADGRERLRVRQRPGGDNVMGAIKFMLPNPLGIYLHDTPDKTPFGRDDRRLSSGCVRLEDAPRLARWLFYGSPPDPIGAAPEQRVDLFEPVPVFITYLTALPARGGVRFQRDRYGRDAALIASLSPAKAAHASASIRSSSSS